MRLLVALLLILLTTSGFAQVKSPSQFFGYELGDRFTNHYRVAAYFEHVAQADPVHVKVQQYGETYEHRPLLIAIIASEENMKNLETIRTDNLKRAGMMEGKPTSKIALVWLSYNVHGNEANSTEASMKTLYELVNPANAKSKEWLKNTVVILDPCINPDGRDRYVNFYNQAGGIPYNADPQAREHQEPWPRGRANHYLFDLNRDWAWLTQTESQARIKVYNQWLPHVHVDFHEQGYNSPYYFAPAAEPYHEVISKWQRDFQGIIGRNNAKYFDEQGWLYFTKERFDLYYPSYGDTYPVYSGAIGMTYEQAGINAGLGVTTVEGDTLKLKHRIEHHYTNGMSTIEISSANADKLNDEFEKFFRENVSTPTAPYKTYVIKANNNPDKIAKLTKWLAAHSVQFGHAAAARQARGFDYTTQAQNNFNLATDDIIIPIAQPKGRFLTTVFEPQSKLVDSLTYDVTAWNLLYSYGMKAFAVAENIPISKKFQAASPTVPAPASKPYAYFFRYQTLSDVNMLSALLRKGIKVRSALKQFSVGGQIFGPGTLVVTRRYNEGVANFDEEVKRLAKRYERSVYTTTTGLVDTGLDLGSEEVNFLRTPRVAVLGGDQTFSLSHGEIWHFFEQELGCPVSVIMAENLRNMDLSRYNVIVAPDGSYRSFDDGMLNTVGKWVSDGGRLILIGNATASFADKNGYSLKVYPSDDAKSKAEKEEREYREKEILTRYGDAERKELSNSIFGAIYKVTLDPTHPISFGLDDTYYSLRTSELHYAYLPGGWNAGTLRGKVKPLIGFAGNRINKKLENTLVIGVEEKGRGQVVYFVDNPLFRSFWENGKLLFANAVFMVGQ